MDTSIPSDESHKAQGTGKRALRTNNACMPCRARKVKCDAAVVGMPCSSCRSRQCTEDCLPLTRKVRARKAVRVSSMLDQTASSQADRTPHSTSDDLDCRSPSQTEPDLFYLNILSDAVRETSEGSQLHTTSTVPYHPKPEKSLTLRNCLSTKLPHLDDIDRKYLVKKGVFNLPPSCHLDAFVKAYFDYVHPFSPVVGRTDFIHRYQSRDCSLLLLYVMLTTASLHAPADVLSACGFVSRSAAQESFFSKVRLLYDFTVEDDALSVLQATIILCMVITDRPTNRDYGYWFHNAINLATKLNLREMCVRGDRSNTALKLHRRIWWGLYSLDTFHVSLNVRRSPLLDEAPAIEPRTEDDGEEEVALGEIPGLLSVTTPQQKAWPAVSCELAQIFRRCLFIVKNKPRQGLEQVMLPLDEWRKSLTAKMHMNGNTGTDVCYLTTQAMSYRYECILCRLIRRQSESAGQSESVMRRLRAAVLELDTIAVRVLTCGTLQDFPTPFITTMTVLLALHIESALDTSATDLVRSMARISISQTMLVLIQGKEIPAIKRVLPTFEAILTEKNLYLITPNNSGHTTTQLLAQNNVTEAYPSSHTQSVGVSPQPMSWETMLSSDMDFLGIDFLDDWHQVGQPEFFG